MTKYVQISYEETGKLQSWTSAMQIIGNTGGCLVRITTRDVVSGSVAEAITFIPNVIVADDGEGGSKLAGCA
jgi:hypothetical protein